MQCVCAILSYVACLAEQYFSTLSHKRTIFKKKNEFKFVFRFSLQLSSETFLILRKTERVMFKNVYGSYVKSRNYLSDFNESGISRQI
jgi:hypothetical protein